MSPKATKSAADRAKADGATVVKRRKIQLPEGRKRREPAKLQKQFNIEPFRAEIAELRAKLEQSEKSASKRILELTAIVEAMSQEKPVRLKVHRNEKRDSPFYMLMEYIDVVPVTYTRKLDS